MLIESFSNPSTPESQALHMARESPEDEETKQTLELAWRLQREDEENLAQQVSLDHSSPGDEDAESLALAIRLQQEEDDALLRSALGVLSEDPERGSPSSYSYEDLLRLSETVGTVSRGASEAARNLLATLTTLEVRDDPSILLGEQCSICRMEFEDADELRVLPCKHVEHAHCLDQWLGVCKCCPLCQHEVEE